MPLYEYQCQACQQVVEVMQKFSDTPLTQCESCQGQLTKLISSTSFQLKGTGWYTTDYKKSSGTAAAPAAPAVAAPEKKATPSK